MFLISCWFKKKVLHISICTRFASLGVLTTIGSLIFHLPFFLATYVYIFPVPPPNCKAFISRIQIHLIQLMMQNCQIVATLTTIYSWEFFCGEISQLGELFLENERNMKNL